jgi:hypothetical protein
MSLPLIEAGTVWRVECLIEYQGTFCMQVWHFTNKQAVSDALPICEFVLSDLVEPLWTALQVDAAHWIYIRAKTVGYPVIIEQTLFLDDITGQQGVFGHPPMVAVIWQVRTNFPSRRGRGRNYHFAIPTPWGNTDNRLNSLGIENHRTVANGVEHNLKLGGTSAMLTMGVFSYKAFSVSGNATDAFAPMLFLNVHQRFTSCSKRRD